ncbi:MAG: hypothetical protein AB1714_17795 [Acidobacteriota bacterium]
MSARSIGSCDARLSWSLLLAAALAAIGLLRLFSDFLTDIDPTWVSILGDSPIHFLARTTDGSLAGNLNVQYFKVMAIPCGLAVLFLVNGGLTGGIAAAEQRWASPRFRWTCIFALAAVCAFCEVEKATHLLGLPTGVVEGERAWLNHVVHTVGGILSYPLSFLFRYRVRTTAETPVLSVQNDPECPGN